MAHHILELIGKADTGSTGAADKPFAALYAELHQLAERQLRRGPDSSLGVTGAAARSLPRHLQARAQKTQREKVAAGEREVGSVGSVEQLSNRNATSDVVTRALHRM